MLQMNLRILFGVCACLSVVVLWSVDMVGLHSLVKKKTSICGLPKEGTAQVCEQDANQDKLVELSLNFSQLPVSPTIPRIVHFLWCTNKVFKFSNYLSVVSADRYLKPEIIIFHYSSLPKAESFNYYDTWFEELMKTMAIFQPRKIVHNEVCNTTETKRQFLADIIKTMGGIYVEETTVFTEDMERLFELDKAVGLSRDGTGFFGAAVNNFNISDILTSTNKQPCPSFERAEKIRSCFSLRKRIYPKTFWRRTDVVGRTVNTLMYGTERPPQPRTYTRQVIPNIAHVLWLRGGQVDYLFYLSCISLIYVAKVNTLFVHGDAEPSGRYWRELKVNPNVKFIKIVFPNRIFNFTVARPSHMSDIFRAMVLLKYGGIYSDVDVIWTQAINESLFRHDVVASYDWAHAYYSYPGYLNLGVSMGRKGALFWKKMLSSFRDFRDNIFGYNGLLKPYKIYERNPDLIFIYERIQVMCFKSNCHPGWGTTESEINWKTDTFSYHWTWPTPVEFHNQSILLKMNSTWAAIGKNVLEKAGII